MKPMNILLAAIALSTAAGAFAHGNDEHPDKTAPVIKEQKPWGIAAESKDATRTIEIRMADNMRFTPETIEVKQGETVKFVVTNSGKVLHEMVIGTRKDLDEHAAMMVKFPNMEHDEPYMTHVKPGGRGQIVWTFNRAGDFEFACLIAGHYQAGMIGRIKVADNSGAAPQKGTGHGGHKH